MAFQKYLMPTNYIKSNRHELLDKEAFDCSVEIIGNCVALLARTQWKRIFRVSISQFCFDSWCKWLNRQTTNKCADVRFATACPEWRQKVMWEEHLLHRGQKQALADQRCCVLPGELGTRKTWQRRRLAGNSQGAWPAPALYKQAQKALRQCLQSSLRILPAAALIPLRTRLCWSLVFVANYFICGKLPTIHHTWRSTVLNISKCLFWRFSAFKQRCFYCLHCCSSKPWSTMQDKSMLLFW